MITLYAIPYRTIVQILLTVTRHYCFGGGATWLAVACTMMALCDAHDNRVPVLHEVCVCRFAVLHVTCIYVLSRGFVCARVDYVLMYDGVVPRHCARCSCG